MKLKSVFVSAAAMMLLASCSDNHEPVPGGPDGPKSEHFISVRIVNPAESRAEGDGTAEGTADENAITSLRFFFFNNGEPALVGAEGAVNYVDVTPVAPNEGEGAVNTSYTATVPIYTSDNKTHAEVTAMLVVANPASAHLDDRTYKLDELKSAVNDYSVDGTQGGSHKGQFVMTSSVYVDAQGEVCWLTPITKDNIKRTINGTAGTADAVTVYLERVVAKVHASLDFSAAPEGDVVDLPLGKAIKLKASADATDYIMVGGKPLYAQVSGYMVCGKAPKSYLFKNIPDTHTDWNLGWEWNLPNDHRSLWAINTTEWTNDDLSFSIDITSFNDWIQFNNTDDKAAYVHENAGDDPATGLKSTTRRSVFLLVATLGTLDDNNMLTSAPLVKFGDNLMLEADAIKKIYNEGTTAHAWVATGETENQDGWTYTNDITRYLEFKVVDGKTVLQLNSEGQLEAFFKNVTEGTTDDDLVEWDNTELNKALAALTPEGVEKYTQGMAYYCYDIIHNPEAGDNNGKYGVVRNHVYEITVKNLFGPGNPKFDWPTYDVITQNHSFEIDANIKVLPWNIKSQDATLNWGNAAPLPFPAE